MRKIETPTALMISVGLLIGGLLWNKSSTPSPPVVLPPSPSAQDLVAYRIHEEYARIAGKAPIPALFENVAGSGFEGHRDGVGWLAQFSNPIWMEFDQDDTDYLVVLDDGAKCIRRIRISDRQVSTAVRVPDDPGKAFASVCKLNQTYYLMSQAGDHLLALSSDGSGADVSLQGVSSVRWVGALDGHLAIKADGGIWLWNANHFELFLPLPGDRDYNRIQVSGGDIFALSTSTRNFAIYNKAEHKERFQGTLPFVASCFAYSPQVQQIFFVASERPDLFFANLPTEQHTKGENGNWVHPMNLRNSVGDIVGNATAPYELQRSWFSQTRCVACDPRDGSLMILDSDNKRVMKLSGPRATEFTHPELSKIGPVFSPSKPAGTGRILWLGTSCYRLTAGQHFDDRVEVSAPRLLEQALNASGKAQKWEIRVLDLQGVDLYSSLYNRVKWFFEQSSADNVFLIVDLSNFMSILCNDGFLTPAFFDDAGHPVGIDGPLSQTPLYNRNYSGPVKKLADYVLSHYGIQAGEKVALFDEKGVYWAYSHGEERFLRTWMADSEFRRLLLDLYCDLIIAIKQIVERNGARFTVLVCPTWSFFGVNEIYDCYGLGGNEARYDAEKAHAPLLHQLLERGVETYDLTYEILRQREAGFPFNPANYHRTFLFHEAFADVVRKKCEEHGVLSRYPTPAKYPANAQTQRPPKLVNAIVTDKGDHLFILHNLWAEKSPLSDYRDPNNISLPNVLEIALRDIGACKMQRPRYEIMFAYVKETDAYGGMDVRKTEKLATLTINGSDLERVTELAKQKNWGDIEAVVSYKQAGNH